MASSKMGSGITLPNTVQPRGFKRNWMGDTISNTHRMRSSYEYISRPKILSRNSQRKLETNQLNAEPAPGTSAMDVTPQDMLWQLNLHNLIHITGIKRKWNDDELCGEEPDAIYTIHIPEELYGAYYPD